MLATPIPAAGGPASAHSRAVESVPSPRPKRNATRGEICPAGNGRPWVRLIRASVSRSRKALSVLAEAAARAIPSSVRQANASEGQPPVAIPKIGRPVNSTIGSRRGFVRFANVRTRASTVGGAPGAGGATVEEAVWATLVPILSIPTLGIPVGSILTPSLPTLLLPARLRLLPVRLLPVRRIPRCTASERGSWRHRRSGSQASRGWRRKLASGPGACSAEPEHVTQRARGEMTG